MAEYLQFGDSYAFWADVWVVPDGDEKFLAQGHIYDARGRGDEMMALIAEGLTKKAGELGGPITHEFLATTDRARALVERTDGYILRENNHNGHPIYVKTFTPEGNF